MMQLNHSEKKSRSLRYRIILPMCMLLVLQIILLNIGIFSSGLLNQMDDTAREALQRTVDARAGFLQQDMTSRWCAVDETVQEINGLYEEYTQRQQIDTAKLCTEPDYYVPFLQDSLNSLISMMRMNAVTGAFLILRTGDLPQDTTIQEMLPGVYLRDNDPVAAYSRYNTDLLFERGPIGVVSKSNISTDTNWAPLCSLQQSSDADKSFFKPYVAALQYPELEYRDLAYWAAPYALDTDTDHAISYSVPLIAEDGTLYGVLGVDILIDYLNRQIPSAEIADGKGAYALYVSEESGKMRPVTVNAESYHYSMDVLNNAKLIKQEDTVYEMQTASGDVLIACADTFSLYNRNAPYSDEIWQLYGIERANILYAMSQKTQITIVVVMAIALAACIVIALFIARTLTKPMLRLKQEVQTGIAAGNPVQLTRTGITELDSLAQGVEVLNAEVIRTVGKLSSILEMSSVNLGAFELDLQAKTVFASTTFFRVFGDMQSNARTMQYADFVHALHTYDAYILPETLQKEETHSECVYEIPLPDNSGQYLWVRIKVDQYGKVVTGFAEDVSIEWREMRKLQYERNHDPLTGIVNRRAFYEKYLCLFAQGETELGNAALIMLDIDNLKYVNDTYGHDSGDAYIRAAAHMLRDGSPAPAIVARISGDEFLVCLYGYPQKEQLEQALAHLKQQISGRTMTLPDGSSYPVRVSAGVAWYPQDSENADELVRFADFAMYKGKHTTKGSFVNFDAEMYRKEAYLLQGTEALNQLIEQRKVEYYFQPIVDVHTGKVFAYEALMRSTLPALASPLDVLTLARQESKLGAIEQITWFSAMRSFTTHCTNDMIADDCHIFINSIANQFLSPADKIRFEEQFRPWLNRIVMEHTEEEQSNAALLEEKRAVLQEWGAKLALDDYGSGYSNGASLLTLHPNIVKVDIGIVRNIDTDSNKRQVVESLITYAHPRNIRVVAEGVETAAETQCLIALGVDYLQGYFFARPALMPAQPSAQSIELLKTLERQRKSKANT